MFLTLVVMCFVFNTILFLIQRTLCDILTHIATCVTLSLDREEVFFCLRILKKE